MATKKEITEKINSLILLTEENRTHLVNFVQATEDESKLARVEKLLNDEETAIAYFMKSVADAAVEAGDGDVLRQLNEWLKDSVRTMRKEAEGEEQVSEKAEAEEVLKQMN